MAGKGEKFADKYGVKAAQIYKGDISDLKIPGPDHSLYDKNSPTTYSEIRVKYIDESGRMGDPIDVWTDPDTKTLWVLDGRTRHVDVSEVNRRRKAEGREPIEIFIIPFHGSEKDAVAEMTVRNHHRRVPTPTAVAEELVRLRRYGWDWVKCAEMLQVETEDPEQWARKLIPIAYCIPKVQELIDKGELAKGLARKFGGGKLDGSEKLSQKAQAELLAEMLEAKEKAAKSPKTKYLGPKSQERLAKALGNGEVEKLKAKDAEVAEVIAATLARLAGDAKALKAWPAVAAVVEAALAPEKRGPKSKKENAS